MKKFYSFLLLPSLILLIPTVLFGQQDAIRQIQEKLMQQRPHHYPQNDPNVFWGSMIVGAAVILCLLLVIGAA